MCLTLHWFDVTATLVYFLPTTHIWILVYTASRALSANISPISVWPCLIILVPSNTPSRNWGTQADRFWMRVSFTRPLAIKSINLLFLFQGKLVKNRNHIKEAYISLKREHDSLRKLVEKHKMEVDYTMTVPAAATPEVFYLNVFHIFSNLIQTLSLHCVNVFQPSICLKALSSDFGDG